MNYGRATRIARAARGLSQKQLAEKAGVDASYVSLLEGARRVPTVATIDRLAVALHLPRHLFDLLAADADDLVGITERESALLGARLLELLAAAERDESKEQP